MTSLTLKKEKEPEQNQQKATVKRAAGTKQECGYGQGCKQSRKKSNRWLSRNREHGQGKEKVVKAQEQRARKGKMRR